MTNLKKSKKLITLAFLRPTRSGNFAKKEYYKLRKDCPFSQDRERKRARIDKSRFHPQNKISNLARNRNQVV